MKNGGKCLISGILVWFCASWGFTDVSLSWIDLNAEPIGSVQSNLAAHGIPEDKVKALCHYRQEHGGFYSFSELYTCGFTEPETTVVQSLYFLVPEQKSPDEVLQELYDADPDVDIEFYQGILVHPMSLNSADSCYLALLPGMDECKALAIVHWRERQEIRSLLELTNAGIDRPTLLEISSFVTLKPSPDKGYELLLRGGGYQKSITRLSNQNLLSQNDPFQSRSSVLFSKGPLQAYAGYAAQSNQALTEPLLSKSSNVVLSAAYSSDTLQLVAGMFRDRKSFYSLINTEPQWGYIPVTAYSAGSTIKNGLAVSWEPQWNGPICSEIFASGSMNNTVEGMARVRSSSGVWYAAFGSAWNIVNQPRWSIPRLSVDYSILVNPEIGVSGGGAYMLSNSAWLIRQSVRWEKSLFRMDAGLQISDSNSAGMEAGTFYENMNLTLGFRVVHWDWKADIRGEAGWITNQIARQTYSLNLNRCFWVNWDWLQSIQAVGNTRYYDRTDVQGMRSSVEMTMEAPGKVFCAALFWKNTWVMNLPESGNGFGLTVRMKGGSGLKTATRLMFYQTDSYNSSVYGGLLSSGVFGGYPRAEYGRGYVVDAAVGVKAAETVELSARGAYRERNLGKGQWVFEKELILSLDWSL